MSLFFLKPFLSVWGRPTYSVLQIRHPCESSSTPEWLLTLARLQSLLCAAICIYHVNWVGELSHSIQRPIANITAVLNEHKSCRSVLWLKFLSFPSNSPTGFKSNVYLRLLSQLLVNFLKQTFDYRRNRSTKRIGSIEARWKGGCCGCLAS